MAQCGSEGIHESSFSLHLLGGSVRIAVPSAGMVGGTGLGTFDQSSERFFKGVVAARASDQAVLPDLGETGLAFGAPGGHDRRLASGGEFREKLVGRSHSWHGNACFIGVVDTEMNFSLGTMHDRDFMNNGWLVTHVTFHEGVLTVILARMPEDDADMADQLGHLRKFHRRRRIA